MNRFKGDAAALEALANDRQGKRLLRLQFPNNDAPAHAFMLANRLDASESLSRDYAYKVEVLSDNATIRHDDVLGKMVTIELVREDGTIRYFNGYVMEFRFVRTDGGFAFYEIVLGPWLSYLRLRQDNVAFHDLSVLALTGRVCEQYIKRDWRHRVAAEDPPITYSCQHNESEHNFLHRHWEARGWFYLYEHRVDGHTLVLCDDSTRTATPIDGERTDMPFQHEAGATEDDGVYRWSPEGRIGSDKVTAVSFNFKHPLPKRVQRKSAHSRSTEPQLEVYENVGTYGFRDVTDGEGLAQLRIEELDARRSEYRAAGNDRTAAPGRWFTLSGHFSLDNDASASSAGKKYLITAVRHLATNNYQDGRGALSSYSNEIVCIAHDVPWRPGRNFNSFEPKIYGVQTALVVGPPGEEIYTDGYGRVKVQFHWDRKGEFNDKSSPWVRVMSAWAGSQFGQISLPRVGMEVVVQFLDGNIHRPLITGCVYNANNMPPWELPANKTQSGILTRSTKDGKSAHANALRFEDRRGEEELWLHAEKDQRIEVEHDEAHWVGNDRTKQVDRDETVLIKRDRTEDVAQDETIRIGRNRTERVGKNEKVTIRGNKTERVVLAKEESIGLGKALTVGGAYQVSVIAAMNTSVGMSQTAQIAASKHTKVGRTFAIDAGDEFSINVGACTFQMRSDGTIFMAGTRVAIESSGPITINGKDVDINTAASGLESRNGGADVPPGNFDGDPEGEDDASFTGTEANTEEVQQVALQRPVALGRVGEQPAAAAIPTESFSAGYLPGSRPPPSNATDIASVESVADAPKQLVFSQSIQTEFDSLWGKSLPDGKAMEYGGVLVADANGDLSLVNAGTSGLAGEYSPNLNAPEGTELVGVFHTHPYSAEEGGHVGASLSGVDAAGAVLGAEKINVVQSGEDQFAFLRTKETVLTVDAAKAEALSGQRIQELMTTKGMTFPAATRQMAREIATKLKLAYYEGRNGVLTKVGGP
jgi:type VI secretion system secreted protein VgrG